MEAQRSAGGDGVHMHVLASLLRWLHCCDVAGSTRLGLQDDVGMCDQCRIGRYTTERSRLDELGQYATLAISAQALVSAVPRSDCTSQQLAATRINSWQMTLVL